MSYYKTATGTSALAESVVGAVIGGWAEKKDKGKATVKGIAEGILAGAVSGAINGSTIAASMKENSVEGGATAGAIGGVSVGLGRGIVSALCNVGPVKNFPGVKGIDKWNRITPTGFAAGKLEELVLSKMEQKTKDNEMVKGAVILATHILVNTMIGVVEGTVAGAISSKGRLKAGVARKSNNKAKPKRRRR